MRIAAAEIARLEAEAKRLAIEERRAAEAAEHAKSAEAALTAGNPEQALELAGRALAIDPGHVLARQDLRSRRRRSQAARRGQGA